MEPAIPDGAYCLFRYPVLRPQQGQILLVQCREYSDPETGGSYTVKTFESQRLPNGEGGWRIVVRLVPINPAYQPIVLKDVEDGQIAIRAELLDVLTALVK
jgi:hypothetical protein